MANESILISEVIPASPQRIFSAWLDSVEHSAFTGEEATIVPVVGGEHSAFGGYATGRTLELHEGSRIVQSWRTTEFPPDNADSRLEITLEPTLGGTLVTLLHTDIPTGLSDRYRQGWNDFYLVRMKAYFADGGAPEAAAGQPARSSGTATTEVRTVRKSQPAKAKTNGVTKLAAKPTAKPSMSPTAKPSMKPVAKPAKKSAKSSARASAKTPASAAARRSTKKVVRRAASPRTRPAKSAAKSGAKSGTKKSATKKSLPKLVKKTAAKRAKPAKAKGRARRRS